MSMWCVGPVTTGGAVVLIAATLAGCASTGEPSGGGLWRAHEVRLQTDYDTTPPVGEIGLDVELDTLRNARGQPVIWARVSATNLSDRDLVAETGAYFHWRFTAYDNALRTGEPLWSDEEQVGVIPDAALVIRLPAGATQVFPAIGMNFGETVATHGPGTYYFAARLWGWLRDPPGGWLTERIPAGAVVLLP